MDWESEPESLDDYLDSLPAHRRNEVLEAMDAEPAELAPRWPRILIGCMLLPITFTWALVWDVVAIIAFVSVIGAPIGLVAWYIGNVPFGLNIMYMTTQKEVKN